MSDHAARRSLLQELDARQDEVLQQLEDLNSRVESLLKDVLADRQRMLGNDAGE